MSERGRRTFDTGTQEALKVLDLPTGYILAMNGGLILQEQLILCLGDGIALDVDLKTMCRLYWSFGGWINRPLKRAVLRFVHCR